MINAADFYWSIETGIWHSGRGAVVPADDAALLEWAAATGYQPATSDASSLKAYLTGQGLADRAPPASPVAPSEVPLWAARAAVREIGLFDAIDAAVTGSLASNPALWEAWNMGNVLTRSSAFIGAMASQFGLSSAHINALFIRAAAISAASQ